MISLDPTKSRLIDAAGEEFAEKGFDGASVRSICRRAGANVAAVNYHFGDKERLYLQAVIEAHRCGVELPTGPESTDDEPAEGLRAYIRHFLSGILAVNRSDHWHQSLMLREMVRPTSASETLVREVIRPRFEHLLSILRRVCPEADSRRLHAIAFSVIGQCLHYRMGRRIAERLIGAEEYAAMDLDYLAEHIAGFTLAALGLGAPLDAAGEPGGTPCAGSL